VASHCAAREGRTFQGTIGIAPGLKRDTFEIATSIQDQIPKFEITTLRTQNDVRSAADALPVSILDLRTEKARNCLSPNGLHRRPTCASDSPCFRAAVPIWEGNRGNSRGHPRQSPHDVVSGAHPDDQPIVRVSYHPSALPEPACARTGKFTASPSPSWPAIRSFRFRRGDPRVSLTLTRGFRSRNRW